MMGRYYAKSTGMRASSHARLAGSAMADVLIEDIFAPVAGRMKGEASFAELRQGLAAHRAKVRDEVRQQLCGGLWSKLQLYVVLCPRTFAENSSLHTPVRDFAPLALSKAPWPG